jgi:hypothetical protein
MVYFYASRVAHCNLPQTRNGGNSLFFVERLSENEHERMIFAFMPILRGAIFFIFLQSHNSQLRELVVKVE